MILFRLLILRRLAGEPVRALLVVLGVALSVAVGLAVLDSARQSIEAFGDAARSLEGGATIRSKGGRFSILSLQTFIKRLPPHLTPLAVREERGTVKTPQNVTQRVTILGLDGSLEGVLGSLEGKAVMSADFAASLGASRGAPVEIAIGGVIRGYRIEVYSGGSPLTFSSGAVILPLADIAFYTGDPWQIDYLVLGNREPAILDEIKQALRLLPSSLGPLVLVSDQERAESSTQLLAAFRLNIIVMILMTAFVCGFTVFNASLLSVRSLLPDLGTLRTIGVTKFVISMLIIAEAGIVALAGCALGLTAGRPLSRLVSEFIQRTLAALYGGRATPVELGAWLPPERLILICGGTIGMCLLGALVPAWQARRAHTGVAMVAVVDTRPVPWISYLKSALAAAAVSAILNGAALRFLEPRLAHAGVFFLVITLILLSPPAVISAAALVRRIFLRARGLSPLVITGNLTASSTTASLCIASLGAAVSLLIGLGTMVQSFRLGLGEWLDYTIQGDIFLGASDGGPERPLPLDNLSALAGDPRVEAISRFASHSDEVCSQSGCRAGVLVGGIDFIGAGRGRRFELLSGAIDSERLQDGRAFLVSESAARHLGASSGDFLTIGGKVRGQITAVFKDYSSDRGLILSAFDWYARHYGIQAAETASIFLRDHRSFDAVRSLVTAVFPERHIMVRNQKELKDAAIRIFDQTFEVTLVMRGVVLVLCFCAFATTLLQLNWERRRELRVLQVLGLGRAQLKTIVAGEALLLTLIASALGFLIGIAIAFVLVRIINPISFGWSFPLRLLPGALLTPIIAAVLGGLLCALLSLRQSYRVVQSAQLASE